ncbi:MAG: VacJ family lipoprotein [Gammaproteobacteria bacterium]|nr:VacJ family lipoprotein [Gammaproteobacteria bacterium]
MNYLIQLFHHIPVFLIVGIASLGLGCASTTEDGDVNDPIESVNRSIYQFNEEFDRIILKPLAKGYQKLPGPVQTGTHNFFSNLDDVVVVVNDVLQLKVGQFSSDASRLTANTIFGIFGLIDVGTPMGLPKHSESFADTLGYWGVGSGPFIVLPILGPSSVRDAPSLVVDFLVHPASLVSPTSAVVGLASTRAVDARSELLKTTDLRDQLALDPYIFTRESYYQWRQNRIYDGDPPKVIIEDFEE